MRRNVLTATPHARTPCGWRAAVSDATRRTLCLLCLAVEYYDTDGKGSLREVGRILDTAPRFVDEPTRRWLLVVAIVEVAQDCKIAMRPTPPTPSLSQIFRTGAA